MPSDPIETTDHTPVFRVGDTPGYHSTGIPWEMIEPHARQAQQNHGQSLERLHNRGGLSWGEALAILEDRAWRKESNAKAKVLYAVAAWSAENG